MKNGTTNHRKANYIAISSTIFCGSSWIIGRHIHLVQPPLTLVGENGRRSIDNAIDQSINGCVIGGGAAVQCEHTIEFCRRHGGPGRLTARWCRQPRHRGLIYPAPVRCHPERNAQKQDQKTETKICMHGRLPDFYIRSVRENRQITVCMQPQVKQVYAIRIPGSAGQQGLIAHLEAHGLPRSAAGRRGRIGSEDVQTVGDGTIQG